MRQTTGTSGGARLEEMGWAAGPHIGLIDRSIVTIVSCSILGRPSSRPALSASMAAVSATMSAALVRPAAAPMSAKRSGFFQGAQMAAPRVAAAPLTAQRARRAVAVEARSTKAAGQIQVDVDKPLGLVSGTMREGG